MRISFTILAEKLIWLLVVFTLSTYIVFETYTWGRYAYLGASVMIVLLSACVNKGRIVLRGEAFYGFMLLFAVFSGISALWAFAPEDALQKALTLLLILLCDMMIYIHFFRKENIQSLLEAVMWTGYLVTFYTISFYGLDTLILASTGRQIVNEFSNVNTIGMTAAISCLIQTHEWQYGRNRKSAVFMIPCILVIAASQSRKALVLLFFGIALTVLIKQRDRKDISTRVLRFVFIVIALATVFALFYSLPFFSGARERMNKLIAGLMGASGADNSTLVRINMMSLGWEWFKKYPVGGVGIGNTHILAERYLARDTYFHNNYVELLSGGGILGFCIYYSMYVYLLYNLWRFRQADRKMFEICLVWLILMLIMDYGSVSYYTKSQWFFLMIHFLNIDHMKRKSIGKKYANK